MSKFSKWVAVTMAVPFLAGFLFNSFGISGGNFLTVGIFYAFVVIIGFGAYLFSKYSGKHNGIITAILLIILVLIPLVFAGTCSLIMVGSTLRELSIK